MNNELKNNVTMQQISMEMPKSNNIVANKRENDVKALRARLMELFAEQKNWQKQLQEVGDNMTFDDVRNKMKQASCRIEKHRGIIVKCEESKKKYGKNVRLGVQIWEADKEYTITEVVYDGNEPIDVDCFYSVEYSQKRIAFWENEISKYEQQLQMMEIAQQQLTQVTQDIADVNEQIKNATMRPVSEPLVEDTSTEFVNAFAPKINSEPTKLYRIDNLSLEICQDKFIDIIITSPKRGKQKVLRGIRNNMSYFNPDCFSHEELANELNNLQSRFRFSKTDVDKAYLDKNG